jgi:hypothetical protein
MKKIFALLAAVVLFTACNNGTGTSTEDGVATNTTIVDTVAVDTTVVAE